MSCRTPSPPCAAKRKTTARLSDELKRMNTFPAYILAGGQSQRFGSDKARAPLDGKPLIVHVAESLKPIASSVTVVAKDFGEYDDLGLVSIGDLQPGLGPMGGLLTA